MRVITITMAMNAQCDVKNDADDAHEEGVVDVQSDTLVDVGAAHS